MVLGTLNHHNINPRIDQRIGICVNSLPHCLNSFSIQMGNDVRYCGGMVFIGPLIEKPESFSIRIFVEFCLFCMVSSPKDQKQGDSTEKQADPDFDL